MKKKKRWRKQRGKGCRGEGSEERKIKKGNKRKRRSLKKREKEDAK